LKGIQDYGGYVVFTDSLGLDIYQKKGKNKHSDDSLHDDREFVVQINGINLETNGMETG
jgi:hypothetical protein